jgi:Cu/Ag efflux protein CusF
VKVSVWRSARILLLILLTVTVGAGVARRPSVASPARHCAFRGVIQSIDANALAITIVHDYVEGYGPAGLLTVYVGDPTDVSRMRVGNTVRATLVVHDDRKLVLEDVVVSGGSAPRDPDSAPRPAGRRV